MESVTRTTTKHIQEFKDRMSDVDRVTRLIEYGEKNPGEVASIFLGYRSIIKDLIRLDAADIDTISKANQELQKEDKVTKFNNIVNGKVGELMDLITQACDPDSGVYRDGVQELVEMMKNADKIKNDNPEAKPVDNDPLWDSVIWGYTNGATDAITDVHFVICHALCRIASQRFKDQLKDLSGAEKKDWLLNAMTDVIILKGMQDEGKEAQFYKQWRDKRPDGLGWISDSREQAFAKVLKTA